MTDEIIKGSIRGVSAEIGRRTWKIKALVEHATGNEKRFFKPARNQSSVIERALKLRREVVKLRHIKEELKQVIMKTSKIKQKNVEPKLKVWLLQGKSITHNQAQKLFRTNRLSEYVRRLRNKQMEISMTMTNFNGEIYGVYKMVSKPKVDRIASRAYMNQA